MRSIPKTTTTTTKNNSSSSGRNKNDCDVLVLGAGPAGLAAARWLGDHGYTSLVLEARDRVGGRVHSSDELGTGIPLDHGAKWIHGACSQNRIIQLIDDLTSTSPSSSPDDAWSSSSSSSMVHRQSDSSDEGEETHDDMESIKPSETLSRLLLSKNEAMDPSPHASRVAKKAFHKLIIHTLRDPESALQGAGPPPPPPSTGKDGSDLKTKSLLDLMQVVFDPKHDGTLGKNKNNIIIVKNHDDGEDTMESERSRHARFCRELLLRDPVVIKALAKESGKEDAERFFQQVATLFNLEICKFFENWEGAPIHEISARHGLDGTMLPGGNALVSDGYGSLMEKLATPMLRNKKILLCRRVISIRTKDDRSTMEPPIDVVVVDCRLPDGSVRSFRASTCIVALPLGVLRKGIEEPRLPSPPPSDKHDDDSVIRFDPPLPPTLVRSIQSLGIAVMNKVELSFSSRWWPRHLKRLTVASYLQTPTYHPWTTFFVEDSSCKVNNNNNNGGKKNYLENKPQQQQQQHVLVCYLAGAFAKEAERMSNERIQKECMAVLRGAEFPGCLHPIPDPTGVHTTRWFQDPLSLGCWTFLGKGSSNADIETFRSDPVCKARGLFFAGEHTCDGSLPGLDLGCVHGAWLSGELAASEAMTFCSKSMVMKKEKELLA